MKQAYITFRSVTFAQKAERILKKAGLECTMQRTPKELSVRGCGYCLRIRAGSALEASRLLEGEKVDYGKLYAAKPNGGYEELHL